MPDTQNAFSTLSVPQPYQTQPSSHKSFYKESDAVVPSRNAANTMERDKQDSEVFSSFLSYLSQAVSQTEEDSEPSQVLDLRFSAEHGKTREEYTANFSLPLGGGDKVSFSKSIWDLMVSLKSDLEKKGVDVDALAGEVNDALDEMGLGISSDWN